MSAPASLRRGWCPGALRPMASGDGLLVRLRITGGAVPLRLADALADASRLYGNGLIDLSGRANLQLRGVSDATLPALTDCLAELGLLDADPDAEAVRNVLASPLAGLDPTALLDIRPIVRALEARLVADHALHALPAKFGFLIDDGGSVGLGSVRADIRFDAIAGPDGILLRIGLGGTAASASPAETCRPDEAPDMAARLAMDSMARHGSAPVMAGLVPATPIGDARRLTDRGGRDKPGHDSGETLVGHIHVGSLPVVGLGTPFGRLTAEGLSAIAAAAEEAGAAELRLTPWRVVLVPGVAPQRAGAFLAALKPHVVTRPDDPRLAVTACAGAPGCSRGTTSTHADAALLAPLARELAHQGVALHVSGCQKGCARPEPSRATLVGRAGRYDLVVEGTAQDLPRISGLSLEAAGRALRDLASEPAHA